jgi:pyrroline-5-carboxylate reductase
MQERIGIVGFGNMGQAIAWRIKPDYQVCVFDKDRGKVADLGGIKVAGDIKELSKYSQALILAVKPQDIDTLLKALKACIKESLVISIAAGISTRHIERTLAKARIIRAMPNIGSRVGESVTCLCRGAFSTDEDFEFANELLYHLGVVKDISEDMMDAATAICGSGPAYVFYFLEANGIDHRSIPDHTRHDIMKRLEKAAEAVGFNREDAAFLAVNTFNSSEALLRQLKMPPLELRQMVSSKGGTTEAAIKVLSSGGTWEEAAKAALRRAGELARRD